MITDEVLRAQLVLAVTNSAKWRARRAEQHPDDQRNISSSYSLAALAKRLDALPVNNPHLAAYIQIMERAVAVAVAKRSVLHDISEIESRCIGRYGFDYAQGDDGNPAPFLFVLTREMTDLVEEEEERITEKKAGADDAVRAGAASGAAKETTRQGAREASRKTRRGRRKRPSQGALAH
ncbi:MAG TPA: hypothetical protein VGU20_22030 [Stellaceae bacterium]|nr:hypothetical protein [Stellaceae bacterium]